MGRPLKKKFFGADTNNNIKVQFHNGTESKQGYIVKQVGARRFQCKDAACNLAVCKLVYKAAGSLLSGEMSITVKQDDGTVDQVIKISARVLTTFTAGGATVRKPWNFSTSTSDGFVQVEEAGTSTTTISTSTGAVNLEGDVET
jgi:hypothetical protein